VRLLHEETKAVQGALQAVHRLASENQAVRRAYSVIRQRDREMKQRILELETQVKRLQADLRTRRGW
jgi:phosphate uptake regulator